MKLFKLHIYKKYYYLLLSFLALSLNGCLQENDVFDDVFPEPSVVVDFAVPAILDTSQTCATLIFPIQLTTNFNNVVSIENEEGLNDFLNSQTASFFASGINLPFNISKNDIVETIATETAFNNLIESCGLFSVATILQQLNRTCFSIQLPITLEVSDIADNSSSVPTTISLNEELNTFVAQNDAFTIAYPITVFNLRQEEVILNNDFELYDLAKTCLSLVCGNINSTVSRIRSEGNSYTFTANLLSGVGDISSLESRATYKWFINDELQAEATTKDVVFELNEESNFEVCVNVTIPNCITDQEACSIINIEAPESCSDISFENTFEESSIFKFEIPQDIAVNYEFFLWIFNDITQDVTTSSLTLDLNDWNPGEYFLEVIGFGDNCGTNNDEFTVEFLVQ